MFVYRDREDTSMRPDQTGPPPFPVDLIPESALKDHFRGRLPGWFIVELAAERKIPFLQVGRRRFFSVAAVEAAIARLAAGPAAGSAAAPHPATA